MATIKLTDKQAIEKGLIRPAKYKTRDYAKPSKSKPPPADISGRWPNSENPHKPQSKAELAITKGWTFPAEKTKPKRFKKR